MVNLLLHHIIRSNVVSENCNHILKLRSFESPIEVLRFRIYEIACIRIQCFL